MESTLKYAVLCAKVHPLDDLHVRHPSMLVIRCLDGSSTGYEGTEEKLICPTDTGKPFFFRVS